MSGLALHPRFVSLEGGEGAGKSTVLQALRAELQQAGEEVICTREPGGTPLAERIRSLLLDPVHGPLPPQVELLLMFASRAQHVREVIAPALERGAWVLCDRFTDASYAYQGGGRGLDEGFIATLEREAVGLKPGLTLLLDVPVAVGRERAGSRGAADRIEREHDAFFERVRDAYLARAVAEPSRFRIVDAGQSAAVVADAAVRLLQDYREALR